MRPGQGVAQPAVQDGYLANVVFINIRRVFKTAVTGPGLFKSAVAFNIRGHYYKIGMFSRGIFIARWVPAIGAK